MTDPHRPSTPSAELDPRDLVWETQEPGVWSAVEPSRRRAMHAGFAHHVGGRYLAVDGLGSGIGAFGDLAVAQSAVALAFPATLAQSIWMRED